MFQPSGSSSSHSESDPSEPSVPDPLSDPSEHFVADLLVVPDLPVVPDPPVVIALPVAPIPAVPLRAIPPARSPPSSESVNGPPFQFIPEPIPYHEYMRVAGERDFLHGQVREMVRCQRHVSGASVVLMDLRALRIVLEVRSKGLLFILFSLCEPKPDLS